MASNFFVDIYIWSTNYSLQKIKKEKKKCIFNIILMKIPSMNEGYLRIYLLENSKLKHEEILSKVCQAQFLLLKKINAWIKNS